MDLLPTYILICRSSIRQCHRSIQTPASPIKAGPTAPPRKKVNRDDDEVRYLNHRCRIAGPAPRIHFLQAVFELGESSSRETFSHDLICDPIEIVVILIIIKVPTTYVRYAWILGVFVLSCCLILLHTYLRTDGLHLLFCCCGQGWIGRGRRRRRERKDGGGLYIYQAGFYWGMLVHLLLTCYFRRGRVATTQKKEKKKPIQTDKNTLFYSFPIPEISRSRPRPRQSTPKPCSSQRIPSRTRNQILDVRTSRRGSFCGNSSCCETSR